MEQPASPPVTLSVASPSSDPLHADQAPAPVSTQHMLFEAQIGELMISKIFKADVTINSFPIIIGFLKNCGKIQIT